MLLLRDHVNLVGVSTVVNDAARLAPYSMTTIENSNGFFAEKLGVEIVPANVSDRPSQSAAYSMAAPDEPDTVSLFKNIPTWSLSSALVSPPIKFSSVIPRSGFVDCAVVSKNVCVYPTPAEPATELDAPKRAAHALES